MNSTRKLVGFIVAAAVAAPTFALAQDHHDDRHDDHRMEQRHDDRHNDHRDDHRDFHDRPAHAWHRGDRVPDAYRDNRYVVDDWRGHHLRQPPSGYHWVQVNGDFVLAAVATGVIADILLNQ